MKYYDFVSYGWCHIRERSFATDVKCFFIYYYVVKVYNYVELEIKLKLLDFFLLARIHS